MSVYHYHGLNATDGKPVEGRLDADSEREARQALKDKGIFPTKLLLSRKASATKGRQGGRSPLPSMTRAPSMLERILFTRQLGSLIEAGMPLVNGLKVMEDQVKGDKMQEIISSLRTNVSEGQALSDALRQYPGIFPPIYINLVKAGENTGSLGVVLERLGVLMEDQRRIKGRLQNAMIYPTIMMVTGFGVLMFLMTVVVPKVVQVFQDSHQVLPLVTRSLLAISSFTEQWGGVIAVTILVSTLLLVYWVRRDQGRIAVEHLLLRMPLFRGFISMVITQRVSMTLSLLLNSGVSITKSLEITAGTSGFLVMTNKMNHISHLVRQGESLAVAMGSIDLFPRLALQMIAAGETTGKLEDMLSRVSNLYEEDIQRMTDRLMGLMEPIIILLMGIVVAYVVVAVLLPIFDMNQLIN